mmetsp:Transcript_10067/g.21508  ORF Transcript_10067/g.21508 Transcript_10067/m.21508 type:complete len:554 (-) Transcript_10067:43-1704(-)|eukprot:CAMPEP_0204270864 /NCGR_PEP_ID=MMETSP0468-20130131/19129_1 /ASSEMBLY_ACC=CAM_ASM_000383 /TAXON_ID=2969 /ORGANISM="Oxyrrhis marina" /LENGTH=553 /DNA_ID=CAMNT_0051246443 /DNA_START=140 /DNA_END=1801 /DNA_ORIENTATION=-
MRFAFVAVAVASEHATTWVPIKMGHAGGTTFFNPATREVSATLPTGHTAAPPVSMLQSGATTKITTDEMTPVDAEDIGVEAPPAPVVKRASLVQATTNMNPEIVEKKACYPRCTWNCTQPVCNQDCTPDCEQPQCQTRCPKPDYNKCSIDCQTPHCSVFCPKDACKSGHKCSSPKCSTKCGRAMCKLNCKSILPCRNVCQPPTCTWNCRNPEMCAKPECRLVCEKPLGCAQNYELPPLSPALTVEKSFAADRARWVTYSWSRCGTKCGQSVRTRKVLCSVGEDRGCSFSPKPPTEEVCSDRSECNSWVTTDWGNCSTTCGRGIRSRNVTCPNDDPKECLGDKPSDSERCLDRGEHCHKCVVTFFGGPDFTGWTAPVRPGKYMTSDLVDQGVQCEEISSVRVEGYCCHTNLFQYGDFNRRTPGWNVSLAEGDYDIDKLVDMGARDNDVSSAKIWLDDTCSHPGERFGSARRALRSLNPGSRGARAHRRHRREQSEGSGETGSTSSTKEAIAESDSSAGKGDRSMQHWWFWLILAVLIILLAVGVYMALRRRQAR